MVCALIVAEIGQNEEPDENNYLDQLMIRAVV
jgi:hypothetical protein